MKNNKISSKKSQAELITTVLLILISIAAVVLVSTFVINMIRENLGGTECFKTVGQININVEDGYTFCNSTLGITTINLERGANDFNLTGFLVSLGNEQSMTTYTMRAGTSYILTDKVKMYSSPTGNLTVPGILGSETYNITTGAGVKITKIKVLPIITPNKNCNEGAVEAVVPAKA